MKLLAVAPARRRKDRFMRWMLAAATG
ncbi:MAG: hypothetical protein QOF65_1402, partial [Thermoleophilaceae bacterium]|nr:hypothetical protein [Thermoleophilaceae bacterium]